MLVASNAYVAPVWRRLPFPWHWWRCIDHEAWESVSRGNLLVDAMTSRVDAFRCVVARGERQFQLCGERGSNLTQQELAEALGSLAVGFRCATLSLLDSVTNDIQCLYATPESYAAQSGPLLHGLKIDLDAPCLRSHPTVPRAD